MGNVLKPFREDPLSFAYKPLLSPLMDPENENLRVFSLTELKKATKNFRQDRVIYGEDGSVRTFYEGSFTSSPLRTKTAVSVIKCLRYGVEGLEAIEAWEEEVKFLGEYSHPNIVKFLGYCCEDSKSLLVFEYFHKGTLDDHIHGKKEVFSWATRVKIAIGIAKGVAFLHSVNNSSLYFELRMHNIMLDEEYNAKLFYLETDKKILGNCLNLEKGRKYMPYECLLSGYFRMDSDVFAFGVILLELFTDSKDGDLRGRLTALRNEAKKLKNKSLDVRTTPILFTEIFDPRLEGDYPLNAAMRMGTLIKKCTKNKRQTRPSMQQVLDLLIHIEEIN